MKDTSVVASVLRNSSLLRSFCAGRKLTILPLACCVLALLLGSAHFSPASAQAVTTWTGTSTSSTDWSAGANWSGGVAPVSGNTFVFGVSGTAGYTLTNTLTTGSFNVAGIDFLSSDPTTYNFSGGVFNLTQGITSYAGQTSAIFEPPRK